MKFLRLFLGQPPATLFGRHRQKYKGIAYEYEMRDRREPTWGEFFGQKVDPVYQKAQALNQTCQEFERVVTVSIGCILFLVISHHTSWPAEVGRSIDDR